MLSDTEQATLQILAGGGIMGYEKWPALLDSLIERLNEITRNEFPAIKRLPPQVEYQAPDSSQPPSLNHTTSSESADKENAPPASTTSNHLTESDDVLPREILIRLDSVIKTLTTYFKTHPPHTIQRLSELILEPRRHYRNLPAYLHALDRVVNVTSGANTYPLPAAFPVSNHLLTNGAASNSKNVAWGNSTSAQSSLGSDESLGGALLTPIPWLVVGSNDSVGSDSRSESRSGSRGSIEREVRTESTQTIEGPNGAGSIETVTVSVYGSGIPNTHTVQENMNNSSTISALRAGGGVTQGELLRQEQELNLIPASQITGRLSDADGKSEDDEIPHARGPEEVGVEDMGPQTSNSMTERALHNMESHGIDVEAAVGRQADEDEKDEVKKKEKDGEDTKMGTSTPLPRTPKREADEDIYEEREAKKIKNKPDDGSHKDGKMEENESVKNEEESKVDEDAEMLLVNEDDRAEGEQKVGQGEESQVGPDAADTTTI